MSLIIKDTTIRLYAVTVEPGWAYTVTSNGAGTNSRVEVQFANPTTGESADLRYATNSRPTAQLRRPHVEFKARVWTAP